MTFSTLRIALIGLGIMSVIALAIGLGVGLTQNKSSDPDTYFSDYGCVASDLFDDDGSFETSDLKIPPRLQWEANFGYCGEVSFIQCGLELGQYLSQFDVRISASGDTPQDLESSQLLLGINDVDAADALRLGSVEFDNSNSDTEDFLAWIKEQIITHNRPVVIGLFTNEYLFYDDTDPEAGNSEYDHIVLVTGISTRHGDTDYHDDDVIYFSDHGLWGSGDDIPYKFCSRFDSFQATREEANAEDAPVYSLPNHINYGIAITGIKDTNGDTVPVRVTTNVNYEKPIMKEGSTNRPASMSLTLTITVSEMSDGVAYNLYWYDDFENVPVSSFNANADQAFKVFENILGDENGVYTRKEKIRSNQQAIFRAVPVNAP
jgi:hypothetical protein